MKPRAVVIGGGIGGGVAARELAGEFEVTLLERSPTIGGLVTSFEVGGTPLECFYHHVFPHERDIIGLVDELGLASRLAFFPSTVGIYSRGRVWPFTSPVDLLRFKPLPLIDRVRTGVGALRLGRVRHWEALDALPARQWLADATGERAGRVVWEPLLRAKFGPAADGVPAAWMWGRFTQRAGGRQRGREHLGYMRGGFRQLFTALEADLHRRGVDVQLETSADSIAVEDGRVRGVVAGGRAIEAGSVLFAGALPGLVGLVPQEHRDPRWSDIGALGVQCTVVELARALGDMYWVNVCDEELSFGGVIAHTNMVPASDYGGRHVAYLSRYFTADEPIATTDPHAEAGRWLDQMDGRWPGFRREDVLAVHAFRTPYAAPLVTVGYRERIPPVRSHVPGLYVSTTAQIYPQDRGMSEGVRAGREAARLMASDRELVRE